MNGQNMKYIPSMLELKTIIMCTNGGCARLPQKKNPDISVVLIDICNVKMNFVYFFKANELLKRRYLSEIITYRKL
jgi:hypothetical protein